ncbi:hypothetical protein BH23ACT10_BH23ACT10_20970 [soil metagenome]
MSRRADPLERQIEATLEPDRFVSDRACFSFVCDLEEVEGEVARLVETEPTRAVAVYQAFLAGCYEKAEELDDSSGSFGMFVTELFCGWIRARQAAGADPEETAVRLLAWMDDDPYGFCHRLEHDVVKVLDKAGRAAFTEQVRTRFEQASQAASTSDDGGRSARADRRRWAEVLRTLYLARRSITAYIQLAEDTGVTAQDCHAVATMLAARRKPGQALSWVERGIELDKQARHGSAAGRDLAKLELRLLERLGREDDAIAKVWTAYRERPSRYTYDDLLEVVPKAERRSWHEKAMAAAMGADLRSLIELLVHTKETERVADVVRRSTDEALEGVGHDAAQEAAKRLEKGHADAAARLWRSRAMRILTAKKSKYYGAALQSLERARRCYEQTGLATQWQQLVSDVRAEHHRKTSFMPGFEKLVRGAGPSQEPSFLERAKARWVVPHQPPR